MLAETKFYVSSTFYFRSLKEDSSIDKSILSHININSLNMHISIEFLN